MVKDIRMKFIAFNTSYPLTPPSQHSASFSSPSQSSSLILILLTHTSPFTFSLFIVDRFSVLSYKKNYPEFLIMWIPVFMRWISTSMHHNHILLLTTEKHHYSKATYHASSDLLRNMKNLLLYSLWTVCIGKRYFLMQLFIQENKTFWKNMQKFEKRQIFRIGIAPQLNNDLHHHHWSGENRTRNKGDIFK